MIPKIVVGSSAQDVMARLMKEGDESGARQGNRPDRGRHPGLRLVEMIVACDNNLVGGDCAYEGAQAHRRNFMACVLELLLAQHGECPPERRGALCKVPRAMADRPHH